MRFDLKTVDYVSEEGSHQKIKRFFFEVVSLEPIKASLSPKSGKLKKKKNKKMPENNYKYETGYYFKISWDDKQAILQDDENYKQMRPRLREAYKLDTGSKLTLFMHLRWMTTITKVKKLFKHASEIRIVNKDEFVSMKESQPASNSMSSPNYDRRTPSPRSNESVDKSSERESSEEHYKPSKKNKSEKPKKQVDSDAPKRGRGRPKKNQAETSEIKPKEKENGKEVKSKSPEDQRTIVKTESPRKHVEPPQRTGAKRRGVNLDEDSDSERAYEFNQDDLVNKIVSGKTFAQTGISSKKEMTRALRIIHSLKKKVLLFEEEVLEGLGIL